MRVKKDGKRKIMYIYDATEQAEDGIGTIFTFLGPPRYVHVIDLSVTLGTSALHGFFSSTRRVVGQYVLLDPMLILVLWRTVL